MDERALVMRLLQGPASGDALAKAGGHTRAAVWKRIESLRSAGVSIDATPGQGYRLTAPLDLLDVDAVAAQLPEQVRSGLAAIEVRWSIDSTNSALLRESRLGAGVRGSRRWLRTCTCRWRAPSRAAWRGSAGSAWSQASRLPRRCRNRACRRWG